MCGGGWGDGGGGGGGEMGVCEEAEMGVGWIGWCWFAQADDCVAISMHAIVHIHTHTCTQKYIHT